MKKYGIKTIIILLLFQSNICLAIDTVKVNEKDALFTALNQSLPLITSNYIGWQENWKWAGAIVEPSHIVQNKQYQKSTFNGQVKNLDIAFNGSVTPNNNNLVWTYNWDKSSSFPNAIGFGIEFKLTLSDSSQAPELLPNNAGWRWKTVDNKSFEVIFTPAAKKIYFERGNKNHIRVLFFSDITIGSQSSSMTVKVDDTVKLSGPDSVAYDETNSPWHKDILSPSSSPIDLSFLNKNDKPAGKQGFIKRKGAQLFFENGSAAKFWGANIQASALFQSSSTDIKRHAKRIAQLGFNLIRIHHHDSSWVNPNIFKNQQNNTHELSDAALKKIDWWVKCLKEEGIYLWLDLHVGRRYTENDGISNFSDFSKGKAYAEAKGFNYYNNDVMALMQAFNKAYLTHINQYTQLAYKDDPAVIALLITNENDLTQHFGNALLANKNVPAHHAIFSADADNFSSSHGLSSYKVKSTWLMGESKIYLNDVEHRFNQQMIEHLQGLGVKSLISTSNSWGNMGLFGLPSLTDGSLIDAHAYGKENEFKLNPRQAPGFLTWAGAAQVTGYPLSITEWNIEPFPAKDRFTAPLFVASIASLQSWDAIMLYGYSQIPLGNAGYGSNYSSYNDPAIIGLMPAAALLYRQNHVAPANKSYALKLNRENFFFNRQDPTTSKTIRTILETSRLTIDMPDTPELPWLNTNNTDEENSIVIHDTNIDFIPSGQSFVESDTGELKRNWEKGIHTINTEKSQISAGWIGGETVELKDVTFKIETGNAVVAVQSLDNKAIRESNKIFITVMARSKPENNNQLPFLSEPVTGQLEIYAPGGLKLYPINSYGKQINTPIALNEIQGKYQVNLSPDLKYHWFVLQSEPPAFSISSPIDGAEYIEDELITIKTNAINWQDKIQRVDFWQDDWKHLGQTEQAPYELSTDKLSEGEHIIRSRLLFKDGTRSTTETINISIKKPPFRISAPIDGSIVSATEPVTIKTNAIYWHEQIQRVDFWQDNWKHLGQAEQAPFEIRTDKMLIGEHIIRSRILFKDGTRSTTDTVNISIKEAPFSITAPTDGSMLYATTPVRIETNAINWQEQIQRVDFWQDDWKHLGQAVQAPFEITTNKLLVGDHIIRSRILFKDGTRASAKTITLTVK